MSGEQEALSAKSAGMAARLSAAGDMIGIDVVDTIPALFEERVRRTPERIAYRQFEPAERCWQNYSWRDMAVKVARWRAGFAGSGLTAGDRVVVLLRNSVEWVCFDVAALSLGLVTVPLHVTDGAYNWADQLADAEVRLLLVGSTDHWRELFARRDQFPMLEHVVCVEPGIQDLEGGVSLDSWLDAGTPVGAADVRGDMLATITYTSGTTGRPKGVMLSHRNLVAAVSATAERNPGYLEDVFLSFLPMAHIFERTTEYYLAMACGGQVAFARSIPDLPQDMREIRPTVIMGVPRIFERVWAGVAGSASSNPLGRWLLGKVKFIGPDASRDDIATRIARWLIGHLITGKLLKRFGGRLRIAVCGGAPLSAELAAALRTIGLPLIEGYGLAEAAGPVSGDPLSEYRPGAVGRPLPGVHVRIAENGEILLRSAAVMSGYWKRPEETAEAIDREGWLHTGDVGELRDGRLHIHGRLRDIIVLSTGEKLAPSDLETRIVSDPMFEQVMVIGDRRPIVVALVVLNRGAWVDFAARNGLSPDDPNSPACERALRRHIAGLCRAFPDYAQIRRVHAGFNPWTTEAGLLSVTLKIKRNAVSAKYADEIEALFSGHA
ncbi:MAG TPA: AMP-dependent synthetase/ligase [Afifellaceae bacterium]|nr:AMP-dependent synthetase/ligase [Afifellaceae bacterium]